jgi:hypothetical protein
MAIKVKGSVVFAAAWTAAALICLPATAHAQYLDPGAGSIIVQAVIAGVVGVAAALRVYWGKISAFFARRSRTGPRS